MPASNSSNETNNNHSEEAHYLNANEESRSLHYILGGSPEAVVHFFEHVWQVSCAVFPTAVPVTTTAAATTDSSCTLEQQPLPCNWERVQENPFRELIQNGFAVLTDLMESTSQPKAPSPSEAVANSKSLPVEESVPLLFRDLQLVPRTERLEKYSRRRRSSRSGGNRSQDDGAAPRSEDAHAMTTTTTTDLWSAFLDGCSVVVNHADEESPWLAALCQDLQRSLPHVYANAYLTPAGRQTVPPHADDRDVMIVQVYGRKHWIVYRNIPVPYPYPHEQVGKAGDDHWPVPEAVLQGPILLERTLEPGDVLYMPRGYVHQATSGSECCSFHVTLAMATHDWSLAGLLSAASQSVWTRTVDFRPAVDRRWGRTDRLLDSDNGNNNTDAAVIVNQLEAQLDRAFQLLREEVTVATIDTALRNKYQRHNQRAAAVRLPLLQQGCVRGATTLTDLVVGPEAADTVKLSTWLRAATDDEKSSLLLPQQQLQQHDPGQRGLHVREEIYEGILEIIQHLKQHPTSYYQVCQLRSLTKHPNVSMICDLTLVSMARRCVELGALATRTCPATKTIAASKEQPQHL